MTEMEGVERVIENPLYFKNKLGIGEDASSSVTTKEFVREFVRMLDTAGAFHGGAAVASSSKIAAIFFAPKGLLAALGIGAAASTPVGWVIAAGVASTAAYYGISRYLRSGKEDGVDVVPKWINTPLDASGVVLFDFFAPLGLKVAALDGRISDSEWRLITEYFVDEWGYSPEFVRKALPDAERNLENLRVAELVDNMIKYQISNPDCNYDALSKELTGFLMEVTRSDGELHDLEVVFIQWLELALAKGKPGFFDGLLSAVGISQRPEQPKEEKIGPSLDLHSDGDALHDGRTGNGSSGQDGQQTSTKVGRAYWSTLHWLTE